MTLPTCSFTDCIHHAVCEHQEPNLCGVACLDYIAENGDCVWCYPTAEHPTCGIPGPAKLRWADIDRSLLMRPLTPDCSTCRHWSPARGCTCHPGGVKPDSEQCTACYVLRSLDRERLRGKLK